MPNDGGVVLTFTNGDSCVDQGKTLDSVAIITMPCSSGEGDVQSMRQLGPCTFTMTFPTVRACSLPVGSSDNTSSMNTVMPVSPMSPVQPEDVPAPLVKANHFGFFSTLAVLFLLYCCGGCILRYKTQQASGLDLIPHLEFWSNLPSCLLQSVENCRSKLSEVFRRSDEYEIRSIQIPFDDPDQNL